LPEPDQIFVEQNCVLPKKLLLSHTWWCREVQYVQDHVQTRWSKKLRLLGTML